MRRAVLAVVALIAGLPFVLLTGATTGTGSGPTGFDRSALAGEIPEPMLSAYLDAADAFDIDWALLAAVGKLECDHGRYRAPGCWPPGTINHAGARGPMQFVGSTWRASAGSHDLDVSGPPAADGHGYATDGNGDGIADPWNPDDAVHAAARYLVDLGAHSDPHTAARHYNAGPNHPDPAVGSAYADRAMRLVGEYRAAAGFGGPGSGLELPTDTTVGPGCTLPDPTGTGGCVTPRTAQLVATLRAAHGQLPIACWAPRPGNPTSDHPRGRACDITYGALGRFPTPTERAQGWAMAEWLIAHADALGISYVIWDGRIWTGSGWRPYTGGGVYNPRHPTGGHFDHIHISVRP